VYVSGHLAIEMVMDTALYSAAFGLTMPDIPVMQLPKPTVFVNKTTPAVMVSTVLTAITAVTTMADVASSPTVAARRPTVTYWPTGFKQVSSLSYRRLPTTVKERQLNTVAKRVITQVPKILASKNAASMTSTKALRKVPVITTTVRRRSFAVDPYLVTPAHYRKYDYWTTPQRMYTWPRIITSPKTSAWFRTTKRPWTEHPYVAVTKRPVFRETAKPFSHGPMKAWPYYEVFVSIVSENVSAVSEKVFEIGEGNMTENVAEIAKQENDYQPLDSGLILAIVSIIFLICMAPVYGVIMKVLRSVTKLKRQRRNYCRVDTDVDLVLRLENIEGQMINCRHAIEKTVKDCQLEVARLQSDYPIMVSKFSQILIKYFSCILDKYFLKTK
jgi:hypothetical protein